MSKKNAVENVEVIETKEEKNTMENEVENVEVIEEENEEENETKIVSINGFDHKELTVSRTVKKQLRETTVYYPVFDSIETATKYYQSHDEKEPEITLCLSAMRYERSKAWSRAYAQLLKSPVELEIEKMKDCAIKGDMEGMMFHQKRVNKLMGIDVI